MSLTLPFAIFATQAYAEPSKILEHTAKVHVSGYELAIPVFIFGQVDDEDAERLRLIGKAGLSEALTVIGRGLETEVDSRHRGCRERWDGQHGYSHIEGGALVVGVTVKVEKWACEKVFGNELKTRLGQETATLVASLSPQVVDGRVQLSLVDFEMRDLSQIARALGVEKLLRDALQREIDAFNGDAQKTSLPPELGDIGFHYEAIMLRDEGFPEAEVIIVGPNDALAIIMALTKLQNGS